MQLGKVICVADPAEAAARDAAMRAGVVDGEVAEVPELPGIADGLLHDSPGAGQLFVQGRVDGGAGPRRFDDVVGAGFRLVTRPGAADRLDPALADWFGGIGGVVVTVGERGDLVDVDGRYDAWFAEHAAVAALQRPDFHLFGTANGEAGPSRLVADLCDALGAP
jgi:hypothetical protein